MSNLYRPVRKIKRRLRKLRRSPIAIVAFLVFAAGAGLVFSLWMQPGDMTLQQARLALNNGKPHLALKMVEPVLQKNPELLSAQCIQAEAHMALHQFTPAKETLQLATKYHPHASVVRGLLVRWTFEYAKQSMQQSGFLTSTALQKTFDEIVEVGRAQARWFLQQSDDSSVIQSRFIHACLTDLDIRRYQSIQKNSSRDATRLFEKPMQLVSYSSTVADLEKNLQLRIDKLSYELEGHLKAVITLAPNHFNAWMMYFDYLGEQDEALLIWESANALSKRHDLPAKLVGRIVTSLLTEMKLTLPQDRIIETGFGLLSAVRPGDRSTVDYKLAAAQLHLLNGDQQEALKLLDQVVESKPADLHANYILAKILFEQEKYSQSMNVLQPLHQSGRCDSQSSLLFGLTLIKTQQYEQAAEVLQQALRSDPDHNAILATFLTLMLSTGNLHKYENEVQDYYADNSTTLLALRLKLKIEQSVGDVEQVIALVDKIEALQSLTDDHRLLILDGLLYLKDHQRAKHYAQVLIRNRPRAIEGYLGLAAAYLQQGQYSKAYEELQLIEKRFSYDLRIQDLQGRCMMQEGRFDRAATLFQSVVDHQPNMLDARVNLAECLLHLGRVGEATELVEGVLDKNPQHFRAHQLVVRAFTLSGQPRRAENYLSHLSEDIFEDSNCQNPLLLAKIKYQKDDIDGAIAVCERAVVGGNIDPALRYYFANLLISKGDHQQAEFHLQKLVQSRPHDPQAYSLLTSFYLQHQSPEISLKKLRVLESWDSSLAQLSQAMVLKSSNKIEEARSLLFEVLDSMTEEQSENAMIVADELAAIETEQNGEQAALDIYDRLVLADWMVAEAVLRQMKIVTKCDSVETQADSQSRYTLHTSPERPGLRFEYMQQYVANGHYDKALNLLDEWIDWHPQLITLRRARAELLVEAGRHEEAILEYQAILDDQPLVTVWARKSRIHVRLHQFPEALVALKSMAEVDEQAATTSLAQQSQLFHQVGLTGKSATALGQLDAENTSRDPMVLLMLGETSYAQQQYKLSRSYLSQIPVLAVQYVRAQLTLAQLDQYEGHPDRSRSRVVSLANNPQAVLRLVESMLAFNMHDTHELQIMRWCDQALPKKLVYAKAEKFTDAVTNSLSDQLKQRWLKIRITLTDRDRRWMDTLSALDQLAELAGESKSIDLARYCLSTHVKHLQRSSELRTTLSQILPENLQSLLPSEPDADTVRTQISKLINADLWSMPSSQTIGWTTLFGSDLIDITEADLSEIRYSDFSQTLAVAFLAREASLPGLSAFISQKIITDHPANILANAIYAQSLLDLHDDEMLAKYSTALQRHLPQSSLALHIFAREKVKRADDAGAIEDLTTLIQREPNHVRIKYALAQSLERLDRQDEAMALLESLYYHSSKQVQADSVITPAIANDFAYLLATNHTDRIEEAREIAQKALNAAPQHRSLLDTLGWIEHLRGQDQQALRHLSSLVSIMQPTSEIHYHIGAVYHALGQDDWAGYHLKQAVRSATESTQAAGRNAKNLLNKIEPNG